jgi:hypothetical protein
MQQQIKHHLHDIKVWNSLMFKKTRLCLAYFISISYAVFSLATNLHDKSAEDLSNIP